MPPAVAPVEPRKGATAGGEGVAFTGIDQAAFDTAANNAKTGCPIPRRLNTTITMSAKLEQ